MIYYAILLCVVFADQLVKRAVALRLRGVRGAGLRFIPGLFHIVYVENTGAAFNLLQDKRMFLILSTLLLIAALIVYMFLKRRSAPVLLTGLALVAGGGLGNLIDRLRLGYVVDYLAFRPFPFPVFNLADVAVCVGCGLLLLYFAASELRARKEKALDEHAE
ncbi:MAG: signal peptidase II [Clostridiales Family XIII bacterium]|nr:signal peptidase II [Clostridiales Family XIII bacterium]